jgi:hypothetical protein
VRTSKLVKVLAASGAALLAGGLAWSAIAVPALVRYPGDLDVTTHLEGTLTLFSSPDGRPLAEPMKLPLTIERHIDGVSASSDTALVKETVSLKGGTVVSTDSENVYAVDRRTLENVADPKAYAWTAANVTDRSGSYRLQLPFHLDGDETLRIWKNETGSTYELVRNADDPTTSVGGLELANFTGKAEAPLSPAYLAGLRQKSTLPETTTIAAIDQRLADVDLAAVIAGVRSVVSAEDAAALGQLLAAPIPVTYVSSFEGTTSVDPVTGTQVDVTVHETIGARPDLAGLAALQPLLAKYISEPAVQAAAKVLTGLHAAPASPILTYDYSHTDATVADLAGRAEDQGTKIAIAERWVPTALVGAGAVLLAIALFKGGRGGFRLAGRSAPTAQPQH